MTKHYWKKIIDDFDSTNINALEHSLLETVFKHLMFHADIAGADQLIGNVRNLASFTTDNINDFDYKIMPIREYERPYYWSGEFEQGERYIKFYGYFERPGKY